MLHWLVVSRSGSYENNLGTNSSTPSPTSPDTQPPSPSRYGLSLTHPSTHTQTHTHTHTLRASTSRLASRHIDRPAAEFECQPMPEWNGWHQSLSVPPPLI